MNNWFTTEKIDIDTWMISEYRHPEETHCYLLNGSEYSLLIDTGLGICNIYDEVKKLTDKPIIAVATHIHWDHIGGLKYFPDFYAHREELEWLSGDLVYKGTLYAYYPSTNPQDYLNSLEKISALPVEKISRDIILLRFSRDFA